MLKEIRMKINQKNLVAKVNQYIRSERTLNKIERATQQSKSQDYIFGWTMEEIQNSVFDFMMFFAQRLTKYWYPLMDESELPGNSKTRKMKNPNYLFDKSMIQIRNIKRSPYNNKRIVGCTVHLLFNPKAVERKSLQPKKYKPVKNIFKLQTVGYNKTRKHKKGIYTFFSSIYGKWRDIEPFYAPTRFEGYPFLFHIIDDYNKRMIAGNNDTRLIRATLDSEYSFIYTSGRTGTNILDHIYIGFKG